MSGRAPAVRAKPNVAAIPAIATAASRRNSRLLETGQARHWSPGDVLSSSSVLAFFIDATVGSGKDMVLSS